MKTYTRRRVNLTDQQWSDVELRAAALGETKSAWIRRAILRQFEDDRRALAGSAELASGAR